MQKSRRQNVEKVKTIVYYRFITHHYSYGGNYMFTIENFIHGIANVTKSLKASINKVFVRMFLRFRIMRYGTGYAIPHFLSRE